MVSFKLLTLYTTLILSRFGGAFGETAKEIMVNAFNNDGSSRSSLDSFEDVAGTVHAEDSGLANIKSFIDCIQDNCGDDLPEIIQEGDGDFSANAMGAKTYRNNTPAIVLFAKNEEQVVSAVKCAEKNEVQPVPRSGGHSYEGFSSLPGSVVIDVSEMNSVEFKQYNDDKSVAFVRAGAGTRLGHLYTVIAEEGFNFNGGTCPGIGLGGHISGGGYGMMSRYFGLAADQVAGFRMVLANGTVVNAKKDMNSDLFWAMRGGGAGSFGIVLEYYLYVYKIPTITVFSLYYDAKDREEVLKKWMDYFYDADKKMTTQLNLDGGTNGSASINGQMLASKSKTKELIEESGLLDCAREKHFADTNDCSLVGTKQFNWAQTCEDSEDLDRKARLTDKDRGSSRNKSGYGYKLLDEDQISQVVEWIESMPGANFGTAQFESYGGKFSEQPNDMTPWSHRDAKISIQIIVSTENEANIKWATNFYDDLIEKGILKDNYQNYPDLDIGDKYGEAYYGDNYNLLRKIKGVYDPEDVFHNPQSIELPDDMVSGSDARNESSKGDASESASSQRAVGDESIDEEPEEYDEDRDDGSDGSDEHSSSKTEDNRNKGDYGKVSDAERDESSDADEMSAGDSRKSVGSEDSEELDANSSSEDAYDNRSESAEGEDDYQTKPPTKGAESESNEAYVGDSSDVSDSSKAYVVDQSENANKGSTESDY